MPLPIRHSALALVALSLVACDAPVEPHAHRNAAVAPRPAALPPPPPRGSGPAALPSPGSGSTAGESWNAAQIDWQPYEAAVARSRAEHKPLCLVLYADWCPHCRNYAHVFEDPRVVARARDFVMVKLNVDQSPDVASRYELDGGYVPRTYFQGADGNVMADVDAHRPRFKYFFDEHDASSLLGAMEVAVTRR